MSILHHDLAHELPEFRDAIHELKTNNAHFRKLFEAYDAATKEIEHMEERGSNVSDIQAEKMKKNRLALKDELFLILRKYEGKKSSSS